MIIYEEILREFQKQKVKYVLVGGIAVNLLGSLRNTADMDILLEMTDENLRKAVTILKKHDYYVKQPVDPIQIADKKTRTQWIRQKHMKAFNFYKKNGLEEVDIIIDNPVSFETAKNDIVWVRSKDIRIPVISIEHLIRMKKNTGRTVDALDIDELKRIKKLRKSL